MRSTKVKGKRGSSFSSGKKAAFKAERKNAGKKREQGTTRQIQRGSAKDKERKDFFLGKIENMLLNYIKEKEIFSSSGGETLK